MSRAPLLLSMGDACGIGPEISVAAALAIHGSAVTRYSVSGMARAPLCGMGVCQECRTTINGVQHQLACQTPTLPRSSCSLAL